MCIKVLIRFGAYKCHIFFKRPKPFKKSRPFTKNHTKIFLVKSAKKLHLRHLYRFKTYLFCTRCIVNRPYTKLTCSKQFRKARKKSPKFQNNYMRYTWLRKFFGGDLDITLRNTPKNYKTFYCTLSFIKVIRLNA